MPPPPRAYIKIRCVRRRDLSLRPDDTGSSGGERLAEVHVKTLRRAAEIAGGEQQLAFLLKVTPSHLALWLAGYTDPPGDVFLRAVDLVFQHNFPGSEPRPASDEDRSYASMASTGPEPK